jgi:formate dehydrogenase iron-sulfur subunit
MEWNDLRDEVGTNVGVYDNPADLTEHSWTVMRFAEYENPTGNLEWLIRKDGCMHCEDPGCLKACPSPGAIVQYANGIVDFHEENCIGCGYCVTGCPFNVPRISKKDQGVQVHAVLGPRRGGPGAGLREDLPDRRDRVRHQGGHEAARGRAHRGPEGARLRARRAVRPAGVGGTHVMYVLHHADKPSLYHGLPDDPRSARWWAVEGHRQAAGGGRARATALAGFFHYTRIGPNEVSDDEEAAARDEARRIKEDAK